MDGFSQGLARKNRSRSYPIPILLLGFWLGAGLFASDMDFKTALGSIPVGDIKNISPLKCPFITWGGDMVTFFANGGLSTKKGTLFDAQGLNIQLTPGDDFIQQVRDYLAGKSPFLRGTFHMIGLASEAIGGDPRTEGVVILQMTWSAGDHMVCRPEVKMISDLRGKVVVLQQGGPHVGMLDDILRTAQIGWSEIKVQWAKDLTGTADSPAEVFRKSPQVAACFAITPDMAGLTGGLKKVGAGAEGTVKGARVLVSTAQLSRSIADVYVCRKDFYQKHKDQVSRFVAGYLKGCEEVMELKNAFEAKQEASKYMDLLKLTQEIYGKKVLPTLEDDTHGLLCDCTLVGFPGNMAFFREKGNMNGFEPFQKSALDLAVNLGYAKLRKELTPHDLDYESPRFRGYLKKTEGARREKFQAEVVLKEIEELSAGGGLDDRTILAFTINFEPNQNDFSEAQYAAEYQRVIQMAGKYGNAVVAVRGHADPAKTLLDLVGAGMKKGILKRTGTPGNYLYSLNGRPLSLETTGELVKLIEAGVFDGVSEYNPRETMQAALNLSRRRAEAVRDSLVKFAKNNGIHLDPSQIQPAGVGIREPFLAKPANMEEAKKNMRVEFRLMKIEAEAVKSGDFDL